MARKNDEKLIALRKEYGVDMNITSPPIVPRGEIIFLPGIRPKPTEPPKT